MRSVAKLLKNQIPNLSSNGERNNTNLKKNMSIWQTKEWGEMLLKSGQAEKIISFKKNEIEIFVEKRKVAMGEYGLFVLGFEGKINKKLEKKLIEICKEEKALFLQIENLDYQNVNLDENEEKFKKGYYKKFITPYTAIIDLEETEEEILKEMKPKGRYNIKLAEKKGIEVRIVEKTDENIKKFYELMRETTLRDKFNGNTFEYYKIFMENIESSKLLLAYFEDKVIAGGIFTFNSEVSIYYYGASSGNSEYRNLMSPYLLQWEAIKYAKNIGSKIYDFLGIASPGEINSPLEGVTDFKLKLTKGIVNVSDSYIYINKKVKYKLIELLKKLRKMIKR